MSEIHAERREPEEPEGAFDLTGAGRELLDTARGLNAGRAARTLTPGAGAALKQTLLAILEGRSLGEHKAPSPATIQVLEGEVRLTTSGDTLALEAGQWGVIPQTDHDLTADSDAVVLLTVVQPEGEEN